MLENLEAARLFFRSWFNLPNNAIIEAKARSQTAEARDAKNAAFFFSGGIDSLSSLRANRLLFPMTHPGAIKDGIVIFGLEVEDKTAFGYVVESLVNIARDAGITLFPVSTNVRVLNNDWGFWYNAYMGPALCAVAQAFGKRFASATIASDYDVPHLKPHGSHALVEPNFSSHELEIRYDGITRTRLEKTKLVADWPTALKNLRVCNKPEHYQAGRLNCGRCEKCIRTMLALIALGALDKTPAFPEHDLSPALVEEKVWITANILPFYEELVPALSARGRKDLAAAVQKLCLTYHGEIGWRARLRRFDREHLDGRLLLLKRVIKPKTAANGK
jgi:hypothetical protein